MKNAILCFAALLAQLGVWAFRTYAFNACCAPPILNDSYAAARATSAPGHLIALGFLMSIWLNSTILIVFSPDPNGRPRAHLLAIPRPDVAHIGRSVLLGSLVISLPIVALSAWKNVNIPAPLFLLFLLGPVAYAFAEYAMRRIFHRDVAR